MAKNIIHYVSPKQAIRIALGKLGFGAHLMQSLELDMVQWVMEAQNLISKDKKVLKPHTRKEKTVDSHIAHCMNDSMIDCVTKGGVALDYEEGSCGQMATDRCRSCADTGLKFTIDECYTHISPSVPDGTEIEITSLQRPFGEDGYPLVADVCVTAIAEYVMWMLCFRERDNRSAACESRWYVLCRIARADLLKGRWDAPALEKLGYIWF